VIGDYVLEELLGKGAMGAVFLARHRELGTRYALKVQRLEGDGRRRLERFTREVQALAKVDHHAGIVRIHHYGNDPRWGHLAYCVMELVEGQDLSQLLEDGPLPVDRALELAEGIARALSQVHAAGITHRDLKPANVLVRAQDGAAVLTDFGLAKDEEVAEGLTKTGQIVGTVFYMSPEQAAGARVGPPTDVHALGAVLFEMLTGSPPFDGEEALFVLRQIAAAPPPAVRKRRPDAPAVLEVLLDRLLAKEAEDRPSAAEAAEAIARVRRGEALAWSRSTWRRAYQEARSRPRTFASVAAISLGLTILCLALLAAWAWEQPRREAREELGRIQAWEGQALTPHLFGLGVGAGPGVGPLDQRRERLEEIAELLDDPGARRTLANVEAYRRYVAHREGLELAQVPEESAGRAPEHLVVDAWALLEGGDLEAAKARLSLVADQDFLPARALQLRIQAEEAPLEFVARAPGLEGTELALPRDRLLARALARGWAAAAEPGAAHPEVHTQLGALFVRLDRSQRGEVAVAKAAAFEAAAAAWKEALLDALDRGEEQVEVDRLTRALHTEPRIAPGDELEGALSGLLAGVGSRAGWSGCSRRRRSGARRPWILPGS
jgi:predicted Ser/Thr protein kinase